MTKEFIYKTTKDLFGFSSNLKIPVFKEKSIYTPEIDENYCFNPEVTTAILVGFIHNRRVMLQGYHGTGKSTHIEQVAARLNWPAFRVNLDGYISRMEFVGKDTITLRDGKQVTEFKDGLLPFALKQPMALILDEYDAARPDVMFVMQRLLEQDGKLTLADQNLVIEPHEHFRIFATLNTTGHGDTTGLYHGTQFINQGQLDRWNIVARLNFLKEEDEINIIKKKFGKLEDELIRNMVKLAGLTRNCFENGDISSIMSPRTILSWAEDYQLFGDLELAFSYAFLNKCMDNEKTIISELYQRIFAKELPYSVIAQEGINK